MDVSQIIEKLGGPKRVCEITGLSKGRISQWKSENRIPTPWRKFLRVAHPKAFESDVAQQESAA